MTKEKQAEKEGVEDWKKRLGKIYGERKDARNTKINNEKEARRWIRSQLTQAFDELESELREQNNIESVSHNAADGHSLESTLQFKFEGMKLLYSIKLCFSAKGVTGQTTFQSITQEIYQSELISSILDWGEEEIINDFLKAHASWED